MTPRVVSFKVYPEAMAGRERTIFDGVLELAKDDFFQAIEVGWRHNWNGRDRVAKLLRTTEMDVADFFAFLLDEGLLNTEDRPMVSVEVAPFMAEDRSEVVVANAKRVWKQAWATATTE